MSIQNPTRLLVLATAVTWLLASNHNAPAQAPSAGSDTEQRLKALEVKMDRILKALEARPDTQSRNGATGAIETARDKVKVELLTKERQWQELRQKVPVLRTAQGETSAIAETLGRYEARRSDLRIKMQDMVDHLVRIEKANKDGGSKAALAMIQALGMYPKGDQDNSGEKLFLQLSLKRKKLLATHGENHSTVKDVDSAIALVRKIYVVAEPDEVVQYCMDTLKAEIGVMIASIEAISNLIDSETKKAREWQVVDERLRNEIDSLRNTLKVLEGLLSAEKPQSPF